MTYPQFAFILIMAFLSLVLLAMRPYGTQPVPAWLDDGYPAYRVDKFTGTYPGGGQWRKFVGDDGSWVAVIPYPFYMGGEL